MDCWDNLLRDDKKGWEEEAEKKRECIEEVGSVRMREKEQARTQNICHISIFFNFSKEV